MFKQRHPAASSLLRAACLALALNFGPGMSAAWAQAAKPAAPAQAPATGATQSGGQPAPEVQQETFGDWRVLCATQGPAKRCVATQEQSSTQTRQRVLAIEMALNADKLEGVLVLPFGLLLDRGVVLQLDEQPAQPAQRFRTCLPAGCVVPVSFDAKSIAALRAGTALKIKVVVESGQEQGLAISLKGLAQALDRLPALLKG